jgi:hypothetical protein
MNVQLEMAEARELYMTWRVLKNAETITKRLDLCNKKYGWGARERIRDYMKRMQKGELE